MSALWWANQALSWIALAGLAMTVANFLYVTACYWLQHPRGLAPGRVADADAPHVLLQIPMFNEPEVAAQALEAATRLDWPAGKLHIQILDDSTDNTAAIAAATAARLRAQGWDIVHLRRDNRAGFKAGALSAGLAVSDAPFIAMLDADFRAPPDWLRRAVPALLADARAAFVQSRCDFQSKQDNALTRVQQLMQDAHYVVEQAARHGRNVPMQANGTATIWRRAAIDEAGGWSGETLTEDLDLTLRVYLRGWHAALVLEPACVGEMPAGMRDWQTQQKRWSSGFLQVARKLLPAIWRSGLAMEAKISTSLLILMQLFFPCIVLLVFTMVVDALLAGGVAHLLVPGLVGAGLALGLMLAMTLPPYLALRRGSVARYLGTLLALPVFMLRIGFANAWQVATALRGRERVFDVTPKQGM